MAALLTTPILVSCHGGVDAFSREITKMSEDRVAAGRVSDASAPLFLVDTRASQSLDPIRLPAKLRDRIERAQRRANAAKDGVSIFSKDSSDSAIPGPPLTVGRRSSTAPAPGTITAATLGEMVDLHRASTANGQDDKMHLPDVVLSHKMRDFEARANTGGGVALFSVEPADRSLQKLSLEDRERVMLVMQAKIGQISSDVEANFARITKALDANGIFDSAANIQRAQTLCLVDLQRRCKLDRLRDEAMREVLQLPTSTARKNSTWSSQSAGKPSHKLSQLLRPPTRVKSAEMSSPAMNTTTKRRKRKPARVSKLPKLRTADGSPNKRSSKNNQTSSPPLTRQHSANSDGDKSPILVGMLRRRGGLAPPATMPQLVAREEIGFSGASGNDGDLYARHPHVAQVLQFLATGELSNNKAPAFNVHSAEADMDHARVVDSVDEWTQRSPSYQVVAARIAEVIRQCGDRQRWDTLGHFGSNCSCLGLGCISATLRRRLENQHATWKKGEDTPRSDNDEEVDGTVKGNNNRQRDKEIYAELQTRIRERLIASERRTRTAAASMRASGKMRQSALPQTAPAKMIAASSSTISLPVGGIRGNQQQSLGVSASEPVLTVSVDLEEKSFSPPRPSRLGFRMSMLEQKIMVDPLQPISRHGRRKESLIGARRSLPDSKAIGRYSEARIAYRRDTAQTWTWHLPPGTINTVDTIAEDEKYNEAKDRFDEEGCDHSDEENNSGEGEGEERTEYEDDDVESIDSSRTSFSARSAMSLSSVKRSTSNANRKYGKTKRPTLQHRVSRGAGGRSAGNTLTGHALSLHARLEVIWRILQFPFSNKLAMLERLSSLQDADAFISALEHWERVTPLVAIRQRMKLALAGFAERGDLRSNEWLTPSEFALVAALPQPSSVPETSSDTSEFDSMSSSTFVDWVRKYIDVVTLQIQKLANDLKTHTGDELQFQGYPYPRHG